MGMIQWFHKLHIRLIVCLGSAWGVACRIHLEMWKHWKKTKKIVDNCSCLLPLNGIHQHTHTHSIPIRSSLPSIFIYCLCFSLSHSYPFLFALRVISLSFHLSNWSARLFALLLSSNCSLMCHNCKVRQRFYSLFLLLSVFCLLFSALCFMFYVLGLITVARGGGNVFTCSGLSLAQDVLIIQFSFSLALRAWDI